MQLLPAQFSPNPSSPRHGCPVPCRYVPHVHDTNSFPPVATDIARKVILCLLPNTHDLCSFSLPTKVFLQKPTKFDGSCQISFSVAHPFLYQDNPFHLGSATLTWSVVTTHERLRFGGKLGILKAIIFPSPGQGCGSGTTNTQRPSPALGKCGQSGQPTTRQPQELPPAPHVPVVQQAGSLPPSLGVCTPAWRKRFYSKIRIHVLGQTGTVNVGLSRQKYPAPVGTPW